MTSNNTRPSQLLINAAAQNILSGPADPAFNIFMKGLLDLVQVFNSSLVESISNAGRNIPRQVLNGPLQVDTNCLAPEFDYDFTSVCDHRQTFRRGDQPYERPCGSYRIALKVENQFGAGNV